MFSHCWYWLVCLSILAQDGSFQLCGLSGFTDLEKKTLVDVDLACILCFVGDCAVITLEVKNFL